MKLEELFTAARDVVTLRRVFPEPEKEAGAPVVAAAQIPGGGKRGAGEAARGRGEAGDLRLSAVPTGAFVIKDGTVYWRPAIDINQLMTVIGVVAVAHLLTQVRRALERLRDILIRSCAVEVSPQC